MTVYYQDATLTLLLGDAVEQLRTLQDGSVNCAVTSPPYYGLRDYAGHPEQIGLEETPAEYVARLAMVFAEVRRVLAEDGTLWLNLGDSYATDNRKTGRENDVRGTRPSATSGPVNAGPRTALANRDDRPAKNLLGIPWRVAFALQDAGWYLRSGIVWNKPNAMPESVQDRPSNRYEFLFLLTKTPRYWFNLDAIREPIVRERTPRPISGRNKTPRHIVATDNTGWKEHAVAAHDRGRNPGDVWNIPTAPLPETHFAAFPPELPRRCILAGCKPGGTVLDPFSGAGTTALVAQQLGRRAIGIDLVPAYHDIALRRMSDAPLPFDDVGTG